MAAACKSQSLWTVLVEDLSRRAANISNGLIQRHKSPKNADPTGTNTHRATKTIRGAILTNVSSATQKHESNAEPTNKNPAVRPRVKPRRPGTELMVTMERPAPACGNRGCCHPETRAAKEMSNAAAATNPRVVADIGNSPGGPTP